MDVVIRSANGKCRRRAVSKDATKKVMEPGFDLRVNPALAVFVLKTM